MATNQQVLDKISEIEIQIVKHMERDKDTCEKVNAMHKLLITGNGSIPLPEKVRSHEKWIEEHKTAVKEEETDRKKLAAEKAKERRVFIWSLLGLGVTTGLNLLLTLLRN